MRLDHRKPEKKKLREDVDIESLSSLSFSEIDEFVDKADTKDLLKKIIKTLKVIL